MEFSAVSDTKKGRRAAGPFEISAMIGSGTTGRRAALEDEVDHVDSIADIDRMIAIGITRFYGDRGLPPLEDVIDHVNRVPDIDRPIAVGVAAPEFADITDTIGISVSLQGVGDSRTIVADIANPITIGIFLSRVGNGRAIIKVVSYSISVSVNAVHDTANRKTITLAAVVTVDS